MRRALEDIRQEREGRTRRGGAAGRAGRARTEGGREGEWGTYVREEPRLESRSSVWSWKRKWTILYTERKPVLSH
jgi:hypothetical protein